MDDEVKIEDNNVRLKLLGNFIDFICTRTIYLCRGGSEGGGKGIFEARGRCRREFTPPPLRKNSPSEGGGLIFSLNH